MIRRKFLSAIPLAGGLSFIAASPVRDRSLATNTRSEWVELLTRIATPVLKALGHATLKKQMPVETTGSAASRQSVTHLEAAGRTLAGISPWLELGPNRSKEGVLRKSFIEWSLDAIRNAVTPTSPDYLNFTQSAQPLVDAAFFAHALIRAPKQLWANLDRTVQQHLVDALVSTRVIKPYESNWLLFSAMIEAALYKFARDRYDATPVTYAMDRHENWYKGDGVYGDGPEFHFDYYNSFVIQPMMLDIAYTLKEEPGFSPDVIQKLERRARRYAEIQERLISPEGTFPPIGRSLAYRCGAFQLLAQLALQGTLPPTLPPGQVRSALDAVIRRSMGAANTFDKNGWLTIGFCGHQPSVGEGYISTGSLYLCTTAFLPLGLPKGNAFWSAPSRAWTSKSVYDGSPIPIDKAL